MRGGTVQINWHDTKPVLTLDFHPKSGLLATGGADFDIKVLSLSHTHVHSHLSSFLICLSFFFLLIFSAFHLGLLLGHYYLMCVKSKFGRDYN